MSNQDNREKRRLIQELLGAMEDGPLPDKRCRHLEPGQPTATRPKLLCSWEPEMVVCGDCARLARQMTQAAGFVCPICSRPSGLMLLYTRGDVSPGRVRVGAVALQLGVCGTCGPSVRASSPLDFSSSRAYGTPKYYRD